MNITQHILDEIDNDLNWEEDGIYGHDEKYVKVVPEFNFNLPTCEMGIEKENDEKSFIKGYD